MEAMTPQEQADHAELVNVVRSCVSALRLTRLVPDEDIAVAIARLENWLSENDERWVK